MSEELRDEVSRDRNGDVGGIGISVGIGDKVVGGEVGVEEIRGLGNGRMHAYPSRRVRCTKAPRTRFLDVLAVTANISRAARAAGIGLSTVHRLRGRDPAFAALWAAAIDQGYARVEERLLAHALHGDPANAIDPATLGTGAAAATAIAEDEARPFDPALALQIVKIGRQKQAGRVFDPGGPRRARSTQAELVAMIDKRLAMLARRDARAATIIATMSQAALPAPRPAADDGEGGA